MTVPRPSRAELENVVISLRGQRIAAVEYALMNAGQGTGYEAMPWDRGAAHEPTHGCQLTTDSGLVVTFTWGDTFGSYGLEVFHRPVTDFLREAGDLWGPVILRVGDHPRWKRLLGREVVGTELVSWEWDAAVVPSWVRLDLAAPDDPGGVPEAVWIVAGCWNQDRFFLATDDVTVAFERAEAARIGIIP